MVKKVYLVVIQLTLASALLYALCHSFYQPARAQTQPTAAPLAALAGDKDATQQAGENVVIFWDKVTLRSVQTVGLGPPVIARALAVVHTAMYEAWSQYDATAVGTLLGAKFRRPLAEQTLANKSEAISYAAYRALSDLFPAHRVLFDLDLRQLGYTPTISIITTTQPAGIGNLAAAMVLTYRHDDGANQLGDRHPGAYSDYTGYKPVNTPDHVHDLNRWQPLRTANGSFQGGCRALPGPGQLVTQTAVGPHWGSVLSFALNDGETITPTLGPILYPSQEFTLQAQAVLDLSANLTDREKAITEYWADGPASVLPPGHWADIAQIVSARDQHSLDQDVKLFFALTNANLDASILAWGLKRIHDSVRPITAIRELWRGQSVRAWAGPFSGTQVISGENWLAYQQICFVTPAFQEFLSGHSTFSAASAEVLKTFTGSDVYSDSVTIEAGSSQVEPGVTPAQAVVLRWSTFSQAADEAGMSRRYGGIHFERGDLMGREVGRKVGARVWQKAQTFFAGTATPVANLEQTLTKLLAVGDFIRVFYPNTTYLAFVNTGPIPGNE